MSENMMLAAGGLMFTVGVAGAVWILRHTIRHELRLRRYGGFLLGGDR